MRDPASFATDPRVLERSARHVTGRANAKLNLFLEVLGRREDGFHEVDTVFHEIDLADVVRVEIDAGGVDQLAATGLPIPGDPDDNLLLKAVRRYREHVGPVPPVRIHIDKHIPVGGGLGGGSADAAFVLCALGLLCPFPTSQRTLPEIASELGSDVPFFLLGGTAIGSGRGEQLALCPTPAPLDFVLAIPPFPLASAKVFAAHALRSSAGAAGVPGPRLTSRAFLGRWTAGTTGAVERSCPPFFNRLEAAAFELRPELRSLKEVLERKTQTRWFMTGSGSVLYTSCLTRAQLHGRTADIEGWGDLRIAPARSYSRCGGQET